MGYGSARRRPLKRIAPTPFHSNLGRSRKVDGAKCRPRREVTLHGRKSSRRLGGSAATVTVDTQARGAENKQGPGGRFGAANILVDHRRISRESGFREAIGYQVDVVGVRGGNGVESHRSHRPVRIGG